MRADSSRAGKPPQPGARLVLCDLLERPRAELPGGALDLAPFAFATVRIEPAAVAG